LCATDYPEVGVLITVTAVAEAVGGGLLAVVTDPAGREVRDAVVTEPGEPTPVDAGDLVLGLGVGTREEALAVLARCGAGHAAALVLRRPLARDDEVLARARSSRVALVELRDDASWGPLPWAIRDVIDRAAAYDATGAAEPGGYDDLFTLADAAAAVAQAPVTIEDAHSWVLAYSSHQEGADPVRMSTIVRRRVPADVVAYFRSRGVFRRLANGNEPVLVPARSDGTLGRLVLPVRAGGELLGSMWVLTDRLPPEAELRELQASATLAAIHLLRLRAQSNISTRLSADRLQAALTEPASASAELRLPPAPWQVVGIRGEPTDDGTLHELALWDSVCRRAGWRHPALTDIAGTVLAVVARDGDAPGSRAWLLSLLADAAAQDPHLFLATSGAAGSLAALPRARAEATELLALRDAGLLPATVLHWEEHWADVVVRRAVTAVPPADLLGGGPLPALLRHDAEQGTAYAETLRAWLAEQGDPRRTAAALHVHPNTLRYRLRRLGEVVPLDLTSPVVRLALQLQLAAVA
jgi:hypothetical protein